MGRAGSSSGGGGGRSFGGGHSSSRSSGGHRVGSSFSGGSRAGSGSYRSSSGGSFNRTSAPSGRSGSGMPPLSGYGPGTPPPGYGYGPGPPPPPRYGYGPAAPPRSYRYGRRYSGAFAGYLTTIIVFIILISVFVAFAGIRSSSGSAQAGGQASTIVREKLDTDNAYMNDCIIDEIGWFDNTSKTSAALKEFWEDTGVQPYIILKDYDPALTTESAKEQWTVNYYDTHFDTENIFLYVYFAEKDADNDIGYMCYANGRMTSSVMDSEAVDIFCNNIDRYWYTDLSTDDVFINAFTQTGNTIMHVSTTGKDVAKWVLIVLALVVIGTTAIILVTKRNKRAKEEAEERERILNTPVHDMAGDDLENKYL